MPTASRLAINEDLDKLRTRKRHEHRLQPSALKRALTRCVAPEDEHDLVLSLTRSAEHTLGAPPYDPARVRAGNSRMALGVVLMGAAITFELLLNDQQGGFIGTLLQALAVGLLLFGAFLCIIGYELRSSEHLPRLLTSTMVNGARDLLVRTHEAARSAGSTLADHLSRAVLTADSAILLFLVVPLLLPTSLPIVHLLVVAAASLLVAKLSIEAAGWAASAIRRGRLLAYQDALASSGSPEAARTAKAIRDHFEPAVGGRWPVSPSFWTKYAGALPGILVLLTVTGLLLALRLLLGQSDTDMLAVGVVALLVTVSMAAAVALKASAECLTPEMAQAKRIVARFPTAEQFEHEMLSDRESVRTGLIEARSVLRAAAAPRRHGIVVRERDFGGLDLAVDATPQPITRISSPSASPSLSAGSSSPASDSTTTRLGDMHAARSTASPLRPDPDLIRR